MITIRPYQPEDSVIVGQLIADVYRKFNLAFVSEADLPSFLGPFQYAYSEEESHKTSIRNILHAQWIWVAENQAHQIVGVLRGSPERLHSLFVRDDYHHQGIGRLLTETFETACRQEGCVKITLAASLYAVPFYERLGYKKSTGQRLGRSFDGQGFPFQPMKKRI